MALFNELTKSFSPDLPAELGSMDQHLDFVLGRVRAFTTRLTEEGTWVGKRWKEVRDDEGFHEAILHIFNPGGEYLLSFDGNIVKGSWRKLGAYDTLILEVSGRSELFDLRYLDNDHFVLSKHGDQARKGQRRYFFLVHEPAVRGLDWRALLENLFNRYREHNVNIGSWVFFLILLVIIIYLSIR